MIYDLFLRRYPQHIFWGDRPTPQMHLLFVQAAHILYNDLGPRLRLDGTFFKRAHDALAREGGLGRLNNARGWDAICGEYLTEAYDIWNDGHGTPDHFLKMRFSLLELLFRGVEEVAEKEKASDPDAVVLSCQAVDELNRRFRHASIPLHYHNGLLHFAHDELTERRTAEPCWELLRDAKWFNVDRELKMALDHADAGRDDAAFHAAKALESTIKIVSDNKGWSTGNERGAANYIDNLVSQKNGRFLEPWEGEMLKSFFSNVRNPHGHGAGSHPAPAFSTQQNEWAIEITMAWIKNLIRRS